MSASPPARLVPVPPASLAPPNTRLISAGQLLHRTYDPAYAANAFNPGKGQRTRFAPINSVAGTIIPTLYAGDSMSCAYYESIFHDVPVVGANRTISHDKIMGRHCAVLEPMRPLKVAQLFTADLMKWQLERAQLIDTSSYHYKDTAAWAAAIHAQFDDIEGLIWTSRRDDECAALMFFGDRVLSSDLRVVGTPTDIWTNTTNYTTLLACADRIGVRITEPDPSGV